MALPRREKVLIMYAEFLTFVCIWMVQQFLHIRRWPLCIDFKCLGNNQYGSYYVGLTFNLPLLIPLICSHSELNRSNGGASPDAVFIFEIRRRIHIDAQALICLLTERKLYIRSMTNMDKVSSDYFTIPPNSTQNYSGLSHGHRVSVLFNALPIKVPPGILRGLDSPVIEGAWNSISLNSNSKASHQNRYLTTSNTETQYKKKMIMIIYSNGGDVFDNTKDGGDVVANTNTICHLLVNSFWSFDHFVPYVRHNIC